MRRRTAALGGAAVLAFVVLVASVGPYSLSEWNAASMERVELGGVTTGFVESSVAIVGREPGMSNDASGIGAPLPRSLVGTAEDGALVVDRDGVFVANSDAIDLFDYYLSALGEESESTIYERIRSAIARQLTGRARDAAIDLLDDYLAYRNRAGELLTGPSIGEDTARRMQYLRELRREIFGAAVAEALFREEEARWVIDLERQRVLQDPDLTPEDRAVRLSAIEADQAPEVLAAQRAALVHQRFRTEEARLRVDGAGQAEIRHYRETQFGVEGANRLAGLDLARQDWQSRLMAYRAYRDERLANTAADERNEIIESVRIEHFDGADLVRVRALDRADSRDSGSSIRADSVE